MGCAVEPALSSSLDHAAAGCESWANDARRAHPPCLFRPLALGCLAIPPSLLPFHFMLASHIRIFCASIASRAYLGSSIGCFRFMSIFLVIAHSHSCPPIPTSLVKAGYIYANTPVSSLLLCPQLML